MFLAEVKVFNELKTPDIIFFVSLIVIAAICVAIYFLIPVFNKKVYEERRANLKKREETFRKNLKSLKAESVVVETEEISEEESIVDTNTES